jgi:hypothetical protein
MRLSSAHHCLLLLTLVGLCMMPVLRAAESDPQEQAQSGSGGVDVVPSPVEKQLSAEATPEKKQGGAESDAAVVGGNVQLQFVSMPVAMESMEVELGQGEAKPLKVEAPSREFSTAYHVQSQETWAVGESALGEGRKRIFTAYGQAPAPKMEKQVILLVRKGARNADGITVIPIQSGPGHFGGGSIFMMNIAKVDIGCEMGEEKFVLAPGEFRLTTPRLADGKSGSIQVVLSHRRNGALVPFFSSAWSVSGNTRSVVGIQEDADNQRLKLQVIRDFEQVPEP